MFIWLEVIVQMIREMFAAMFNIPFSLPRAFRIRRETGMSFRSAWMEAIGQRWKEREVGEEYKYRLFQGKDGGSVVFWNTYADMYGVNLNIDEIDRIFRENRGHDENGFAKCIIPLHNYAQRQWRKQRPWHYHWHNLKTEIILRRL